MKKLGILMLAMLLVCGMSLGVMASYDDASLRLNDHLDVGHNIDVNVTVEKFAHIGYLDTEPINFTLDAPGASAETFQATRAIKFAANTDVYLEFEENISTNIAGTSNLEDLDGSPLVVLPYIDGKYGDEVDASGISIDTQSGRLNDTGALNRYAFDAGYHEENLRLHIGWNAYLWESGKEPVWDEYSWWDLEADDYTGNVTVTITAVE